MWYEIQSRPLKSQIPGLDSLRGIAIMGVVGYHLFPGLLPGGFLGVNLFFVLSGYLIAITSRREQVIADNSHNCDSTQTVDRESGFCGVCLEIHVPA